MSTKQCIQLTPFSTPSTVIWSTRMRCTARSDNYRCQDTVLVLWLTQVPRVLIAGKLCVNVRQSRCEAICSLSEIVWLQSICVSTRTGKMFTFLLFPELNKKLFWSLIFVNQCILILFILVFPHFEISATFHIFNRMLDAWLLKYSKTS